MSTSYHDFIEETLLAASHIANSTFGKVAGTTKRDDNNQVLTETDLAVGKLIIDNVIATYPTHNIIDEEVGVIDSNSAYTWVVDPIDGTSNFAAGIPLYGIMLGLLYEDKPIAGGVMLPAFHELYIAEKGKGAYCNNKKIAVSKEKSLKQVLIAYGIDAHPQEPEQTQQEGDLVSELVLHIRNLRTSNSVFDTAMVAKGSYGGTMNKTSRIWDNVAQQIIIEEAGGAYTDFFGKPMDYTNPLMKTKENYTFCAAPKQLHKKLLEVVLNAQ